jgi:hypothetical protein
MRQGANRRAQSVQKRAQTHNKAADDFAIMAEHFAELGAPLIASKLRVASRKQRDCARKLHKR